MLRCRCRCRCRPQGLQAILRRGTEVHQQLNPKVEKAKEVAKDLINYK